MPARARATDPATSHAAARAVEASGAAGSQRERCLAVVLATPGQTSAEIAKAAGLDRHSAARRLPELEADGLVRRSWVRECKVNGTPQATWWPPEVGETCSHQDPATFRRERVGDRDRCTCRGCGKFLGYGESER